MDYTHTKHSAFFDFLLPPKKLRYDNTKKQGIAKGLKVSFCNALAEQFFIREEYLYDTDYCHLSKQQARAAQQACDHSKTGKTLKYGGYYCRPLPEPRSTRLFPLLFHVLHGFGGSVTLEETGMLQALREADVELIDRGLAPPGRTKRVCQKRSFGFLLYELQCHYDRWRTDQYRWKQKPSRLSDPRPRACYHSCRNE